MSSHRFAVAYTAQAQHDLMRLYAYLLDHARYAEDLARAQAVIDALREHIEGRLSRTPYLYRHAEDHERLRELIVPGPGGGYVAMYDITSPHGVTVLAVRHQLEDDYL